MPKPNLFIVGAPKCGTTAWFEYLRTHPDIYFPMLKEPNYFCFDLNCRMVSDEEDYIHLFDEASSEKILGDASVRHINSSVAAKMIHDFSPDAKIIVFVRAQEDYLPSLHNQALYRSNEWIEDFEEAWRLSGKRDKSAMTRTKEPKFLDYKALGRFSEQVERYFAVFPAEQIRVFHFRDWSRDPRATYLEILRFLGLPDNGRTQFPRVNEAKHQRARWLARLLSKPPRFVRTAARLARRTFGRAPDRLVGLVANLNKREGYLGETSDALRQEIRDYYAADNALLEARIWKPRDASAPC